MNVDDLVKLSLSKLETALDKGAFSKNLLAEALKAEKEGKKRSGAIELYEQALGKLDENQEKPETKREESSAKYTIKKGASICFRAGIKAHGDEISPEWVEFKRDESLFDSMIANGTLVEF